MFTLLGCFLKEQIWSITPIDSTFIWDPSCARVTFQQIFCQILFCLWCVLCEVSPGCHFRCIVREDKRRSCVTSPPETLRHVAYFHRQDSDSDWDPRLPKRMQNLARRFARLSFLTCCVSVSTCRVLKGAR